MTDDPLRRIGDILRDMVRDGILPGPEPTIDENDPDARFLRELGIAPYAPDPKPTYETIGAVSQELRSYVREEPALLERDVRVYAVLDRYDQRYRRFTAGAVSDLVFDAALGLREDPGRKSVLRFAHELAKCGDDTLMPGTFKLLLRTAYPPAYQALCNWHLRNKGWGA